MTDDLPSETLTKRPFRLLPSTIALAALGLGMLAVGVWVEHRAAVAAPLVVLGALVVVAGVVLQGWAETIEELSVSQAGLTLKRQLPTPSDLTDAGLSPEAAREVFQWMTDFTDALPGVIDA